MSRPSVTYINQLFYADVPYPTTLNPGDVLRGAVSQRGQGRLRPVLRLHDGGVPDGREAFRGKRV